jgi:hypothetical protein
MPSEEEGLAKRTWSPRERAAVALCRGRCGTLLKLLQFVRGNDKFSKTAVQTDYDFLANIDGRKVCPLYVREAR